MHITFILLFQVIFAEDYTLYHEGKIKTVSNITDQEIKYNNPEWLLHDQIGYFFLNGGEVISVNVSTHNLKNRKISLFR